MTTSDRPLIELGLDTFGDVTEDSQGNLLSHPQVIRNLVEQAVLADQVGVDFIGIGEHHREDFAISAPDVVLSAIAAQTERIRLGSAVTVLSSDDPIRVFQRYATIDAISKGRAEIQLGRGSFTESFPLFGFSLKDYDELFEEKVDLFAAVHAEQPVTWEGKNRPPLRNAVVVPPTESGNIPVWLGVGGNPQSVVRAARYGFRLMLAIIGGDPLQFAPFAKLYRDSTAKLGQETLPIGQHSPGHIAETDELAQEQLWPHYQKNMERIGRERGWLPMSKAQFRYSCGPEGALYVGSPETVARKIVASVKGLGLGRFDLKYANGTMPHELLLRSIELYGTQVIPRVKELLAEN